MLTTNRTSTFNETPLKCQDFHEKTQTNFQIQSSILDDQFHESQSSLLSSPSGPSYSNSSSLNEDNSSLQLTSNVKPLTSFTSFPDGPASKLSTPLLSTKLSIMNSAHTPTASFSSSNNNNTTTTYNKATSQEGIPEVLDYLQLLEEIDTLQGTLTCSTSTDEQTGNSATTTQQSSPYSSPTLSSISNNIQSPYYFEESTSAYTVLSLQGNRSKMQDTHSVIWSCWNNVKFFGVFDGHGTDKIANYLRDYLFLHICTNPLFSTDVPAAIKASFSSIDAFFLESDEFLRSGCVCVCAILINELLYIVNLGDCRAVLCHSGDKGIQRNSAVQSCIPLSFDHTPTSCESDVNRILQNNGGVCFNFNSSSGNKAKRVAGELNVTRAFGDAQYKPYITAEPDIHVYNISTLLTQQIQGTDSSKAPFLVLASDGLWDDFNMNDASDVCAFGHTAFAERALERIYNEKECLRDNMTIITVNLEEYLVSCMISPSQVANPSQLSDLQPLAQQQKQLEH